MSATSAAASGPSEKNTGVQPLSIHFLCLRKVTRFCKVGKETKPPLMGLIEKIVALYNGANPKHHYERYVVDQPQGDFRVEVYGQRTSFISKLGRWVEGMGAAADLTVQKISYLIFYRREWKRGEEERREIFALTTGQAYRVVERLADYRFPIRVAKRIAAPEVWGTKRRPLSGAVLTYSEIFKRAGTISPSEAIGELLTRARFAFRKTASMFHLGCFQTQKGKPTKQGTTLEIGLGLVRFVKQLRPEDFQEVLPHLSKIARGDRTLQVPGNLGDEKDSEELDYLDYLQPVDFMIVPRLEKQLVNFIYATVVKRERFPPLDFCHSHRSDYFRGFEHQLQYGNQRIECTNPFSASAMVQALRQFMPLSKCSDLARFTTELAKVFVFFSSNGEARKAPFTDFFEGEVRTPEGDTFWRLHKVWFQVGADYLGLAHQEFIESLHKTLISSGEGGALSEKWPSPKEKDAKKAALKKAHKAACKDSSCTHGVKYDVEAEYNAKHIKKKGYYFGDKICPQGVELFDILYHTKQEIYLYHVKEGFGQKTRDACSQVVNAARLIHTLKHQASSNILKEFYQKATEYKGSDPHRKAVRDRYLALGLKGFLELFAKRKIVFVYALIDDAKSVRLLSNDRKIKVRVEPADIEKANARFKARGQKIFDALVKESYLMKKGYLTSRFFSIGADKFSLNGVDVPNQLKTLYAHLSSHASQFDSTIAKLEILRTQREVEKLGFEFRIHQILRTDYPDAPSSGRRAAPPKDHAMTDELEESEDEFDEPLEIGEGSDFQDRGVTYHIHPTEGDLACGLHALLGQSRRGRYIFTEGEKAPWLAVREHYVARFDAQYAAFRNQISQCLSGLLEDYLGNHPSRYVPMVFDRIAGPIATLKAELARIKTAEDTAKQAQEGLFRDLLSIEGDGIQEHLSQSLGVSVDDLQNNQDLCIANFPGSLNNVLNGIRGTDIEQQISANRLLLDQLDQQRKDLYTRFVQTPPVIDAYRRACLNRDYFFSNEELTGIGSWIFGLRVTLFAHQGADRVAPLQNGPAGGPDVYIFHKGAHFSRCEIVPPAAAAPAAAVVLGDDSDDDVRMGNGAAAARTATATAAPAAAAVVLDDDPDDDVQMGNAPARTGAASATATATPSEPMDTGD